MMSEQLWSRRDLVVTAVIALVGGLGFVYCCYRGSGVASYDSEKSWLLGSAAFAGLIVTSLFHRVYSGLHLLRDARQDSVARSLRLFPDAAADFERVGGPA